MTLKSIVREHGLVILAAWAMPGLLAAFETYTFWRIGGVGAPFWRAVVMEATPWLAYVAITPLAFRIGERFPLERNHLARNLGLHLLVALVAGAAYVSIATYCSLHYSPIPSKRGFVQMAMMWYLSALPLTVLAYFCIIGVGAALTHFSDARRREVDAARLSEQLADARLAALRMQLHPHFLFNTLNAITVLARDRDHETVVRMLTLLSELLRDVLREDHAGEIALREELAFARRYLEIEMIRFADRLTIREAIDPATLDAKVPTFVLQPLLENALRHGIAPVARGGTITIATQVVDGRLVLRVDDDGAGVAPGALSHGVGIVNTQGRLHALYGERGLLSVATADGVTRAEVVLPYDGGAGSSTARLRRSARNGNTVDDVIPSEARAQRAAESRNLHLPPST